MLQFFVTDKRLMVSFSATEKNIVKLIDLLATLVYEVNVSFIQNTVMRLD